MFAFALPGFTLLDKHVPKSPQIRMGSKSYFSRKQASVEADEDTDSDDMPPYEPERLYRPEAAFSTWTRVTSLARARDGAARDEDYKSAAEIQAPAGRGGCVGSVEIMFIVFFLCAV